jgi:hypothetical protein
VIVIRRTLEPGTIVFNSVYGFGVFKGFEIVEGDHNEFAFVEFDDNLTVMTISRRKITEIVEDEPRSCNNAVNKEKVIKDAKTT